MTRTVQVDVLVPSEERGGVWSLLQSREGESVDGEVSVPWKRAGTRKVS